MKPTLLVLAAGIGSRYGGLKQLDPVGPNGETIIDYSVYDAIRAGFGKVVFIIRYQIEAEFKEFFGRRFAGHIPVEYVYQELDMLPNGFAVPEGRKKPWGTGHAVLVAREAIAAPFAAINADDFYGAFSFQALADFLRSIPNSAVAEYAMVGFRLRNTLSEFGTVSRGVCRVDNNNYLQQVEELTKIAKDGNRARYTDAAGQTHPLTGNETVSMNMWGFAPTIFDHLQTQFVEFLTGPGRQEKSEFYIPTVANTLIQQHKARVKVLPSRDIWVGVTYQEDRPVVIKTIQKLIEQGLYPEKLWA